MLIIVILTVLFRSHINYLVYISRFYWYWYYIGSGMYGLRVGGAHPVYLKKNYLLLHGQNLHIHITRE